MTQQDKQAYEALMSAACICGAEKQPKMSHCRACYYALRPAQRRALYRRIGSGYSEAYADSVITLKVKGRL